MSQAGYLPVNERRRAITFTQGKEEKPAIGVNYFKPMFTLERFTHMDRFDLKQFEAFRRSSFLLLPLLSYQFKHTHT